MGFEKSKRSADQYRDEMDGPMEDLAVAMWGVGENGPVGLLDHQIVEVAAKKIKLIRAMLVSAGVHEKLVQDIMNEG